MSHDQQAPMHKPGLMHLPGTFICASCSSVFIFWLLFPTEPSYYTHWKECKVQSSWALPRQINNVNLRSVEETICPVITFPSRCWIFILLAFLLVSVSLNRHHINYPGFRNTWWSLSTGAEGKEEKTCWLSRDGVNALWHLGFPSRRYIFGINKEGTFQKHYSLCCLTKPIRQVSKRNL